MGFQEWCDSLRRRRRRLISSARQQWCREEKSVGAPTDGASSVILRLSGANPEWLGMGEVRRGRRLGPLPIPQAIFHRSDFSSKGLLQVQFHPNVRHCCQNSQHLPRPGCMICPSYYLPCYIVSLCLRTYIVEKVACMGCPIVSYVIASFPLPSVYP